MQKENLNFYQVKGQKKSQVNDLGSFKYSAVIREFLPKDKSVIFLGLFCYTHFQRL